MNKPLTLKELKECAQKRAAQVEVSKPFVLGLTGNLGAGKTTFAQAFIRYFDPEAVVVSPTFSIVQYYAQGKIAHYDLYRIKHPDEFYDLDIFEDMQNKICLIEWPEILDIKIPTLEINIVNEALRRIHLIDPIQDRDKGKDKA